MTEEKATLPVKDATVTLQVSDRTQMNAYVARPSEGDIHPGLLVFQEAFGVNAHIRDVTRRFAAQGIRRNCSRAFPSHGSRRFRGLL